MRSQQQLVWLRLLKKYLNDKFSQKLDKSNVVILGGTGPVGVASAVICAKAGSNVILVGRSLEKAEKIASICNNRYDSKNVQVQQMQKKEITSVLQI